MALFRDVAIRARLQRMIALTTVLALAIACSVIIGSEYHVYRQNVVARVAALADIIAANSVAAVSFHDPVAARETLHSFITNPEILSARIFTPSGQVFAEYLRPGQTAPLMPLGKSGDAFEFEGNQLILQRPIQLKDEVLGLVVLRGDMRPELRQLQRSVFIVLGCMVLAAVIGLALARRLQRYVLDPILDLAMVAGRVAQTRDYSLRATQQSHDEVGVLTGMFNDMLGQIQQRDQEVSEAYEELARTTGNLQTSEERFRQLAENISEVFWMTNVDKTEMIYVSPAYETVWGRTCESLYRDPVSWHATIHPDDRATVLAALPEQSTGDYDREYRIVHSSGTIRWIRDRAFPIRDTGGHVYRLAGIARDITTRKRTELEIQELNASLERRVEERTAQLMESESRLRLALEASKAGVWSWDVAENRAQWDEQYHEMYGFEPGNPVSFEAWLGRVHPEDRARLTEQLQALLQSNNGTLWSEDFRVLHPVKGLRWMSGLGRVVRDATGQAVRFGGINLDITERKLAEEKIRHLNEVLEDRVRERTAQLEKINVALRAQQQEQQTILDSVPAFIWYKDHDNRMVRLNRSAAAALGKTVAEMEGHLTSEFYPDEAGKYYQDDLEVMNSGQPKLGIVESLTGIAGQKLWVQTDKVPFRDERGVIIGIIVCAIDITARIEAAEKLRQAEAKYRLLVEGVPAVTYTVEFGMEGRWHFVSPQIEPLLGFTAQEWMDDSGLWYRQIHPDDRELARRHNQQVQTGGQSNAEYRLWTRDGRIIWVRDVGVTQPATSDSPALLQGILYEITARKLAEVTARESQERLEAILDNSTAVIYLKQLDGKYLLVNRYFETLFHVARAGVLGKTDGDLFPAAQVELFRRNDRRVLESKRAMQFEEVVPQADGPHTYISVKFPLFDAAGQVYALCGISTDITDRQRLQQEVFEVSDREQRRIGQDLHDGLCQVLTGAGFAIQALAERLTSARAAEVEELREIAGLVQQANAQARTIARGLHPVELEAGGLVAALRELVHNVSWLYKVDCQFEGDPDFEMPDLARAVHVYRIVQEAVTNALKHGDAHRIAIRLASAVNQVTVSVTDDGTGLGAPDDEHAGMGLSIMTYRARMLDGTLRVQPGDAGGTVVELNFPAA